MAWARVGYALLLGRTKRTDYFVRM